MLHNHDLKVPPSHQLRDRENKPESNINDYGPIRKPVKVKGARVKQINIFKV